MIMKIGVITYWESQDNYGQLLQAWALQQVLKQLGHEPYLIRYQFTNNPNRVRQINFVKNLLKYLLIFPKIKEYKLKKKIHYLNKRNKERQFDSFRENELILSTEIYPTLKNLREGAPEADVYITGSDQVWSQLLDKEENKAFFLDFGSQHVKRISYAPSFSIDTYPTEIQKTLKEELSHFNNISVREKQGQIICEHLGFNATLVLDPTLLLSQKDYDRLLTSEIDNKEIYVYSLNIQRPEDLRWDELQKFADNNKKRISVTTSSGYYKGFEILPNAHYVYPTIEQWILNIKNAALFITSSFHGVAFAIQMHTPFIYVPLQGEKSAGNSRILELLNNTDLTNRILNKSTQYKDFANSEINWNNVDERLLSLKNKSILFLKNSLRDL